MSHVQAVNRSVIGCPEEEMDEISIPATLGERVLAHIRSSRYVK